MCPLSYKPVPFPWIRNRLSLLYGVLSLLAQSPLVHHPSFLLSALLFLSPKERKGSCWPEVGCFSFHQPLQRITESPGCRYSCKVRVKGPGGLRGEVKFSSPPALMSSEASAVIHIAVGVPSTTRGTQLRSPEELPVLNAMLPSMLATIEQQVRHSRFSNHVPACACVLSESGRH